MKAHECSIARTMRIDFDESRLDREKEKGPKTIQVASLGRLCSVKGGVSRVIECPSSRSHLCSLYRHLQPLYRIRRVTRADRGKQACPGVCLSSGLFSGWTPFLGNAFRQGV